MARLRIHLLGPPEVHLGDSLLSFPTRKTLALLIYLAAEGGQQPREHLATLFWPESTPERSHATLRNTLGRLQSALREAGAPPDNGYLSVTHTTLALNLDANVVVDLHTIERAYMQARGDRASRLPVDGVTSLPVLQAAAEYYRSDFLVGFSLPDAPFFDDWAASQREVWRRYLGLIFDRLSEIQFAQGEFASTAETASRWITLDPLNEKAYRRKIRAHFAAGERGQALDTFELCRAILMNELGINPAPETEALVARIRTQELSQLPALPHPLIDTSVAFLGRLFGGRASEHQALTDLYRLAVTGEPQVGILRGEAGIGKTRLAVEFLNWAGAQGARALRGRAFESGSRTSYQPLIEAIRPLFDQGGTAASWIGEEWTAPLRHLLPDLRDPFLDTPGIPLEIEMTWARLFETLVRVTLSLSEQSPFILFVDDLQWADRATLDWLVYAVRRWRESNAPILLLVSLRSEALQSPTQPEAVSLVEWLAQVAREVKSYHQELAPLSDSDTVQMVLSVLAPPNRDFAEWVFTETNGHPFYLIETLKDLLERGVLHPTQHGENQWAFEVDAEHDLGNAVRVPSTVRAVIRSRLSRLSPNAFTFLVAAAILDQRLTFGHLCAIANIPEDLGLSALDEVVSARLLWEVEQPGKASAYSFANDMIKDVVYTEAGDARRRLFHRRALELLKTDSASAAVLAHHAVAAGLDEAAFLYSLTAGQEALRLAAVKEAQVHLEQARHLALEGTPGSEEVQSHIRDLYLQLAEAYEQSGQAEQAQSIYEELQKISPD